MTKINFAVFCIVFIGLGLLANWFWFPEYLLVGVSALTILVILIGFGIGIRNMIMERKKMKAEREAIEKEGK